MSDLGHKRTFRSFRPMSALPPKADLRQRNCDVRFVPKADIRIAAKNLAIRSPRRRGGGMVIPSVLTVLRFMIRFGDWLPEAITDLVEPCLGARFVEIAARRTTDADCGNGLVTDLDPQRARL